ncbi:lysylphosphatidylglycerol synthase transmembrane domain-containing protein [Asanoa ferruginea]|uniref:lysylphosphatidylglycerol synthase transmembrane domain-containing protein n=1 Tax=Asanoa ferruginea TaxID=53367 RepID=UPI00147693AF|nr:lysylphosphatidylglycerol synthase transmembrane domain-containing protein [Asanoa ferruginea]
MSAPASPPAPPLAPPRAKKRKSVLRRVAEIVITVAFVGYVAWSVSKRWSEVQGVIGDLSVSAIALSLVGSLAAVWCSFLGWRVLLADFGSHVPLTGAMRIFFVGQLGKYLPGKVWPVLTQMRLGKAYQVPGRSSAAAVLITMFITLGTGLLLTAVVLPLLGGEAWHKYWWTLFTVPIALVVLLPPVLNRLLALAMRLARREAMPKPLSAKGIGLAVFWAIATWLCYGAHLWALLLDFGAGGSDLIIRSVAAFAGAWSIGFLLAIAPAGLGPRETALVVLLAGSVSEPVALVAALVSRLLMTVADLAWPAIALLTDRKRKRPIVNAPDIDTVPDPTPAASTAVASE